MTKEDFINAIVHAVTLYTNSPEYFDSDPKLRINPATLDVVAVNGKDSLTDIAFSEEAIEDGAYAEGDATESSADFQASRNPDFFAIREYVRKDSDGHLHPDKRKINTLANSYFPENGDFNQTEV